MPTLIRLIVVLLLLAGLAYGGMVALTILVDPGQKDVTVRIPARDLVPAPDNDPLGIKKPAAVAVPPPPPAMEGDSDGVATAPGTPE